MLHGFTLLACDGVKLYAKHGADRFSYGAGMMLAAVGFMMLASCASMLVTGATTSMLCAASDTLLVVMLITVTLPLTLTPMLLTSGVYQQLGMLRSVRAAILADIVLEALLAASTLSVTDWGSATTMMHTHASGYAMMLTTAGYVALLVLTGKPPFDLSEAESELIAGTLTELPGATFSFTLLSEGVEMLAYIHLYANQLFILASAILCATLACTIGYIGRLILVRIAVTAIPHITLCVLLWVIGTVLNIKTLYSLCVCARYTRAHTHTRIIHI